MNVASAERQLSRAQKWLFSKSTAEERAANFEDYWEFTQRHSGELFEADRELARKREKLAEFKSNPVRSRQPLVDPELFYRNYVTMKEDMGKFDRKTLMLTCVYKFARHEWVGISGAWDATPEFARCKRTQDKISRVHLAEEFCHVRYFHEMLETFHLDKVVWQPLGPKMQWVYRQFPKVPESLMSPLAFITELMGITFYCHLDRLFDDVLADEPEARDRLRELLYEIMVDEIAHIGQRRNFCGNLGVRAATWMIKPLFKAFFADLPESRLLFDVPQMIRDAQAFNYSGIPQQVMDRSWVPSYLRAEAQDLESRPS